MPRIFLHLPSTSDWVKTPPTVCLQSFILSPRLLLFLVLFLLCLGLGFTVWSHFSPPGVTSADSIALGYSYGVVVDAGSTSSKVQLYRWPPHTGDPAKLLDIQPIQDEYGFPLRKKVEPGIATFVNTPDQAYRSLTPLLDFALSHIPEPRWTQTSLYVLCTAGMRLLEEEDQATIVRHLSARVAEDYPFHIPQDAIQVISGQMEGVYSWLTVNYLLHRFDPKFHHTENSVKASGDGAVTVNTVGSLDMGGASFQIAFEVPLNVEAPASHSVDINLGCGVQDSRHKHRVYVNTYLGFGSNKAIKQYHKQLFQTHKNSSRVVDDSCSPYNMHDEITSNGKTVSLRGSGQFVACKKALWPILQRNSTSDCRDKTCKMSRPFQKPPVKFTHLEFFGTSEFFYTMRDVLRIAGRYDTDEFDRSSEEYCAKDWAVLEEHYRGNLYPYADYFRVKTQCAKSAWMSLVLHEALGFPRTGIHLSTAAEINQHNVHWSLGAILYLTRYLPLREIQQQARQQVSPAVFSPSQSPLSMVTDSSFTLPCLMVVIVALVLLLCRHRRPRSTSNTYTYCGLYRKSVAAELLELPLVQSGSHLSMTRNLSSRKLSSAIS